MKSRLLGILKGGKELVGVDNPREGDLYRVPIISEKTQISWSLDYNNITISGH